MDVFTHSGIHTILSLYVTRGNGIFVGRSLAWCFRRHYYAVGATRVRGSGDCGDGICC